jgi:hypothetical protein
MRTCGMYECVTILCPAPGCPDWTDDTQSARCVRCGAHMCDGEGYTRDGEGYCTDCAWGLTDEDTYPDEAGFERRCL